MQTSFEPCNDDQDGSDMKLDCFDWAQMLMPWSRQLAIESGWLALHRMMPWISILFGAGLAVLLFGLIASNTGPLTIWVASGLVLIFTSLMIGLVMWAQTVRKIKRRPLRWVAAVVDERRNTRNMVASALEFDDRGPSSGFEALTVAWGKKLLANLNGSLVKTERIGAAWLLHQQCRWLAIGLAISLIGGLAGWLWPTILVTQIGTSAVAFTETDPEHGILNKPQPTDEKLTAAQTRSPNPQQQSLTSSAALARDLNHKARPEPQREQLSSAAGSGSALGASRESTSTQNSSALAIAPSSDKNNNNQNSNRSSHQPGQNTGSNDETRASASTGQSVTSGAGQMSRSGPERLHDWRVSSTSSAEPVATNDAPETLADESVEPQQQRLGLQPLLRDRNAAPSRQLGISGPKGPPGTGRGGPTPVKRSRGTAAMLVGVPLPELVQSPAQPGAVRTTVQPVQPQTTSALPGEAGQPVENVGYPTGQGWILTGADQRAAARYLEALRQSPQDQKDTDGSVQ